MEASVWIAAIAGLVVGGSLVGILGGRRAGGGQNAATASPTPSQLDSPGISSPAPEQEDSATSDRSAHWTALQHISGYLRQSVERPLEVAASGEEGEIREGLDEALGALHDLYFYLAPPAEGRQTIDLVDLVRGAASSFKEEAGVEVRVQGGESGMRVRANTEGLKDALFLLLHNAAQFSGGKPIDVRIRKEDGGARVLIQDRGIGFSAEALARAYDPFYTTLPGNLGLGLPHARRIVAANGGRIHIRNGSRGGGEVEVGFSLLA